MEIRMKRLIAAAFFWAAGLAWAQGQLSQNMQDWMRRINSGEFAGGAAAGRGGRGGRVGGAGAWLDGGNAYVGPGRVRIDTATGASTPLPADPSYTPPRMDRAL